MTDYKELDFESEVVDSFLQKVWEQYGIDFRDYGKAHLKRRIRHRMTIAKYQTLDDLIKDVLSNQKAFDGLFGDFSINVTELFRDPHFYEELSEILKNLKISSKLKIWATACASGEEVFSIVMLLEHLKIEYDTIIATDFNPLIVDQASKGMIELSKLKEYLKNLERTKLDINFFDYFYQDGDHFVLKSEYLSKIEFVTHNLMVVNEFPLFDVIFCRNVLIYFEKNLQNRVIDLLSDSLSSGGILCLGSKESLRFMDSYSKFNALSQTNKIYQKL